MNAGISALLALASAAEPAKPTPRQEQGLAGMKACVMLLAHPGKLDSEEQDALTKAGLVFGAVLAGER